MTIFTRRLMHVGGVCLAACLSIESVPGQGTLLYSNARTWPPTPLGLVLAHDQFAGMRFQLPSGAIIDGIGGNIAIDPNFGDGRIFGALVKLTDMSDYPDSTDLSTPDVLAATAFSATPVITDAAVPIGPLTVGPGTYALVLGSGLFGASGDGAMSINNLNSADSSTFWLVANRWDEYGAAGGLRFAVYGTAVPEPGSLPLMLLAALVLCRVRWSREFAQRRSKHD